MRPERGTVAGVFADLRSLEAAVADLRAAGFRDDQLSVAYRQAEPAPAEREEPRLRSGEGADGYLLIVRAAGRNQEAERVLRGRGARVLPPGELVETPPAEGAVTPTTGYGIGVSDFGPGLGPYESRLVVPPEEEAEER